MDFQILAKRARDIRQAYNEHNFRTGKKVRQTGDYVQGLVGDIGDLVKLLLHQNTAENPQHLNQKIRHELADVLWSLLAISDSLGVDLEQELKINLEYLEAKLLEK